MTNDSHDKPFEESLTNVGDLRVPEAATVTGRSPDFDQGSVPEKLLEDHFTKPDTWGRLIVLSGEVIYRRPQGDGATTIVPTGHALAIPPGEHHAVELSGESRFFVEFWQVRS